MPEKIIGEALCRQRRDLIRKLNAAKTQLEAHRQVKRYWADQEAWRESKDNFTKRIRGLERQIAEIEGEDNGPA